MNVKGQLSVTRLGAAWSVWLLILSRPAFSDLDLSNNKEISGIERTCDREPDLAPQVASNGFVRCKDFQLYLQLLKMGKTKEAHMLVRTEKQIDKEAGGK